MTSIKSIRTQLERKRGEQAQTQKLLQQSRDNLKQAQIQLADHEEAREIIREVGLKTQQALSYHISDITSLALEAVFDDPYELVVDFIHRRNKTECDLWFQRDGNRVNPLEASGGGAVDVASFALRVACWSMENPRTRPVIILDEPMKFVSRMGGLQERASQMIKEISQKLGIQFIIVTHEETLTESADKVFTVTNRKGKSTVSHADKER